MKYGCIGKHLTHSFSKEIHTSLADYEYELKEIPKDRFNEFMAEGDFKAINVTIPYKEAVIPYLYFIDDTAKEIGAVSTIVNKDGRLYGYNTDFYGMKLLIEHAGIELNDKKVAVLGTGGTSKTANAVAKKLLAREILTVSRTKKPSTITYEELYENHSDIDVVINTTPSGMFPENFSFPLDIERFPKLSGVIDAVYNPLRTKLVSNAKNQGIKAEGGLYMLVSQGVLASEIFLEKKYEEGKIDEIFCRLKRQKENIVLIGMPSSGKSTIGGEIAKRLGRDFYDTDELVEEKTGMKIPNLIELSGEENFRDTECEVVKEVSKKTGVVIATGGGVILREENVNALRQNGKIYFLDRPLEKLVPTEERPLTSNMEALAKKYNERYDIYVKSSDVKIDASGDINTVSDSITGDFEK